jgi:hypothetical protein
MSCAPRSVPCDDPQPGKTGTAATGTRLPDIRRMSCGLEADFLGVSGFCLMASGVSLPSSADSKAGWCTIPGAGRSDGSPRLWRERGGHTRWWCWTPPGPLGLPSASLSQTRQPHESTVGNQVPRRVIRIVAAPGPQYDPGTTSWLVQQLGQPSDKPRRSRQFEGALSVLSRYRPLPYHAEAVSRARSSGPL